jgi:hypothetical protein
MKNKLSLFGLLLLGSLVVPQKARALFDFGGYSFPKSGVQPESVLICNTRTGEKQKGGVNPSNWVWTATLGEYIDNDSTWIKGITSTKDTINETFYKGVARNGQLTGIPSLVANSPSLNVRHVLASTVDSGYAKAINLRNLNIVYAKYQTKISTSIPRFKTTFDATELNYQIGDSILITLGLRDSSATSLGIMEEKYIDADTATSPVTLTYAPRFRDVSITGISQLPDTVTVDSVYPRFMRVKNNSDLRDEKVLCTLTRTRNGETLETRIDSVNLGAPHFSNDSAEISFPDWTVSQSDTGLNVLTYTANPGVDSLIKTEVESVYAKLNDTTGIQEAKLQKYMKQRASLVTGAEFVSKYGKNYDVFDAVGRRIDILNVRENGHGNRNRNSGGHLKMYFVKEKNVLDEVRKVLVVD